MEMDTGCMQCGRCAARCPMFQLTGYSPRRLLRHWQLGALPGGEALRASLACTGCLACSVTCPRQAAPAEVVGLLKEKAGEVYAADPRAAFHREFRDNVAVRGRLGEAALAVRLARYQSWQSLRAGIPVGLHLWRCGKLRLTSYARRRPRWLGPLLAAAGEGWEDALSDHAGLLPPWDRP